MSVKVETNIVIEIEQGQETLVLVMTLEEARALKDELIRAVGAQNPIVREQLHDGPYAPVINIAPGKNGPRQIPEHLLKRAQAARDKVAAPDVRGSGVLHPNDRPKCHCGDAGWGENGCCGVSGCNNVPG